MGSLEGLDLCGVLVRRVAQNLPEVLQALAHDGVVRGQVLQASRSLACLPCAAPCLAWKSFSAWISIECLFAESSSGFSRYSMRSVAYRCVRRLHVGHVSRVLGVGLLQLL